MAALAKHHALPKFEDGSSIDVAHAEAMRGVRATFPEAADVAADVLRNLMPALGHIDHMPSHIDVRRRRWKAGIAADRGYREASPKQGFYRMYSAHNSHVRAYAAMMAVQRQLALSTIGDMVAAIRSDWLQENGAWADVFIAMPYEVEMHFGRWDEILAEPPRWIQPVRHALDAALRLQYKDAEATEVEARFSDAWKDADVTIASSGFCRSGV